MPENLKSKVQEAADSSGRSLHAELLFRLEASFATEEKTAAGTLIREMKRTQLLLERAELQAQYGRILEEGRGPAKALAALREDSVMPGAKDLELALSRARLEKSHLDAKISAIDGRLAELSRHDEDADK